MFYHVTICRFSRRGILCLACLLASKVISLDLEDLQIRNGSLPVWINNTAYSDDLDVFVKNQVLKVEPDNGTRWTVRIDQDDLGLESIENIEYYNDKINDALHAWARSHNNYGPSVGSMMYGSESLFPTNADYRMHYGVLGYLDKISNTIGESESVSNLLSVAALPDGSGNYITTLFGLLAGWAPNSLPNTDGIPLGVETNGIWGLEQKQVSLQETLTNQLERFITLQAQNMTNLIYGISPQLSDNDYLLPNFNNPYRFLYYFPLGHTYSNSVFNQNRYSMLYSLGTQLFLNNISMLPYDDMSESDDDVDFYSDLDSQGYLPLYFRQISNSKYKYYGTKWVYDSMTNNLYSSSVPLEDITDATSEQIDDYVEKKQDEHETFNNEYTPVKDSRIDTDFLEDALLAKDDLVFSSTAFDTFKSEYRNIFNFSGTSDLQYGFSLSIRQSSVPSSHDVNIQIADVGLLSPHSAFLNSSKATIDQIIRIIISLNLFICILVLSNKAFKLVSEVFSS